MRYWFGEYRKHTYMDAPSLEIAKKIFKATELFPEQYVSSKYIIKNEECEYNWVLERYEHKFKPGALIPIEICEDGWETVGSISLQECLDFSYDELKSTSQKYLPSEDESGREPEKLPVVGNSKALSLLSKNDLRKKHDLIKVKMNELEQARNDLVRAKTALQKELDAKKRVIYIIETFLGVSEEVIELKSGEKADESVPLSLYQQKLYMDEELGIWSDGGMDFQDLDKFDEWITDNYEKFLYDSKSVCAWQIRRKSKNYSNDSFLNAFMNEENFKTYFLIRNGDCLYRIFSNIHVSDKMFPREDEFYRVYEEAKKWRDQPDYIKDKMEQWHDSYLFTLLAIQGMIERTDIFGTSLRGIVNLSKSDGIPSEKVKFIRDAETEHWIGDGRPSWYDFLKQNRRTIKQGTRVVLSSRFYYSNKDDRWRNAPFRAEPPSRDEIYIVDKYIEKSDGNRYGYKIKIYYNPYDEVYYQWRSHKRKRRVPFRLYLDEVINVDDITFEDINYYLHNRLYRKDYLRILPILYYLKCVKEEEIKLEKELVKYLAGQLGWSEDKYSDIRYAITWWKLKNKWKRAVTADEAKAVRMILKRLKR